MAPESVNTVLQVWIFVFGISAVYLVGMRNERYHRYGFWAGVISQPAWLLLMIHDGRPIMLVVALFYSYVWTRGLVNNYLKGNGNATTDGEASDERARFGTSSSKASVVSAEAQLQKAFSKRQWDGRQKAEG